MESEIQLDQIQAIDNNRESFDQVALQSLADSIKENGLIQAIVVRPLANGAYGIVAGERRTRAARLAGLQTIRARIVDLEDSAAYLLTLEENNNRQDVNPIEESNGYIRAIDIYGIDIDTLAKKTGKRRDYIDRRIALKSLVPEARKLCAEGTLGITYAIAMVDLDTNRQRIALRALRDKDAPTIQWFRSVCYKLLEQQNQVSMFDLALFGGSLATAAQDVSQAAEDAMPADPAQYAPQLDPNDIPGSARAILGQWEVARAKWQAIGRSDKADQCGAIVSSMRALLEVYPIARIDSSPAARILRHLSECENATTAELYQFANVTKNDAAPVIARLVANGKIARRRAGRGYRYSLQS